MSFMKKVCKGLILKQNKQKIHYLKSLLIFSKEQAKRKGRNKKQPNDNKAKTQSPKAIVITRKIKVAAVVAAVIVKIRVDRVIKRRRAFKNRVLDQRARRIVQLLLLKDPERKQ